MHTKVYMEDSLNEDEIRGVIEKSIFSSQIALINSGVVWRDVLGLKKMIDGLASNFWSSFVMATNIRNDVEKEKSKNDLAMLDEQIQRQLTDMGDLISAIQNEVH